MPNPLVSVIIPAYNHEHFVQETIESIINQSYQAIELIVVDDGSKDGTWDIIQELAPRCRGRFTNFVAETQANAGTCMTLNRQLSLAQGKYVYLIASDDVAKSHSIERQVEFLESHDDYSLIVGDNEFIDSESKLCYRDESRKISYQQDAVAHLTFGEFLRSRRHDVNFLSEEFGQYKSLCKGNYVPNGYLMRKSTLDCIGLFTKDAPLEDYWLMLQLSKCSKLKYVDEVFFSYRLHDNNTAIQSEKMLGYTEKTCLYEFESVLAASNNSRLIDSFQLVKTYLNLYRHDRCRMLKQQENQDKIKIHRDQVLADRDKIKIHRAQLLTELDKFDKNIKISNFFKYINYPRWLVRLASIFIWNKQKRHNFRNKWSR